MLNVVAGSALAIALVCLIWLFCQPRDEKRFQAGETTTDINTQDSKIAGLIAIIVLVAIAATAAAIESKVGS